MLSGHQPVFSRVPRVRSSGAQSNRYNARSIIDKNNDNNNKDTEGRPHLLGGSRDHLLLLLRLEGVQPALQVHLPLLPRNLPLFPELGGAHTASLYNGSYEASFHAVFHFYLTIWILPERARKPQTTPHASVDFMNTRGSWDPPAELGDTGLPSLGKKRFLYRRRSKRGFVGMLHALLNIFYIPL